MKITDVFADRIVLELGGTRYSLTSEQIALIVRHAYWRMDIQNATYLARIIADALRERPPETTQKRNGEQRYYYNDVMQSLVKIIREHNPPHYERKEQEAPEPETEESEQETDEKQDKPQGNDDVMATG